MNPAILNELIPVVVNLFVVTVFFAYLFIKTPSSYKVKFLGIPLLLISAFISVTTFDDLLGNSVWGPPTTKFALIAYHSYGPDADRPIIEAWLYLPDSSTKLYKFPYSEELEKKLKDVMAKQAAGQMMMGEWVSNLVPGTGGDEVEGLTFKILTPSAVIPK